MDLSGGTYDSKTLNEWIRKSSGDVLIENCCGQRFIGCGSSGKRITVYGTPGNALGSYLDSGRITVNGNVQDAAGDTMNGGEIIINGNAGDALGYGMRGGAIFVKGTAGYRTGIHMKQYGKKIPVIVVGCEAGSFLGEYLAGGLIIVLGIGCTNIPVGNFTGTGMHGGEIFIRTEKKLDNLPEQVCAEIASDDDKRRISPYVVKFSEHFNENPEDILSSTFYILRPNAKNPYRKLYTQN